MSNCSSCLHLNIVPPTPPPTIFPPADLQILSATLVASRRDLGIVRCKAGAMTSELERLQAEFEDVSSSLLLMREHAEALELSVLEARTQLVYLKRKEEHEKEFLRETLSSKVDQGKVREREGDFVTVLEIDNREKLHRFAAELDMVLGRGVGRQELRGVRCAAIGHSMGHLDGSMRGSGAETDRSRIQEDIDNVVSRNRDANIVGECEEEMKQRMAELLCVTAKVKDARELWGILKTQCDVARSTLFSLRQSAEHFKPMAMMNTKTADKVLSHRSLKF
jgi:hypothetical protein